MKGCASDKESYVEDNIFTDCRGAETIAQPPFCGVSPTCYSFFPTHNFNSWPYYECYYIRSGFHSTYNDFSSETLTCLADSIFNRHICQDFNCETQEPLIDPAENRDEITYKWYLRCVSMPTILLNEMMVSDNFVKKCKKNITEFKSKNDTSEIRSIQSVRLKTLIEKSSTALEVQYLSGKNQQKRTVFENSSNIEESHFPRISRTIPNEHLVSLLFCEENMCPKPLRYKISYYSNLQNITTHCLLLENANAIKNKKLNFHKLKIWKINRMLILEGMAITASEVFNVYYNMQKNYINIINIFSKYSFIIDRDLYFPGISLHISVPCFYVLGNYSINLGGDILDNYYNNVPQSVKTSGYSLLAGKDGGNFYAKVGIVDHIGKLTIISNGGNGMDGMDGKDGVDCNLSYFSLIQVKNEPCWDDLTRRSCPSLAKIKLYDDKGTKATRGQKGHLGGVGGAGGTAGKIILDVREKRYSTVNPGYILIIANPGENGKNGESGRNGNDGKNGKDCYGVEYIYNTRFIKWAGSDFYEYKDPDKTIIYPFQLYRGYASDEELCSNGVF